jgi:AraC-like DNA-binding protein
MQTTVIDTERLPSADRFPSWQEMMCRTMMPFVVRTDRERAFAAKTRAVDLAGVKLTLFTHPSLVVCRTPRSIRDWDPEVYQLSISYTGNAEVTQDRRTAELEPCDMTLCSSSRPFEMRTWGDHSGSMVLLPRDRLPLRDKQLQPLIGERMSAGTGLGALVRQYVHELVSSADRYQSREAIRLATLATDMIAAALAHQLDEDDALPPPTHQAALFAQIQAYIHQHLADPSPQTTAAAHHISTRFLHKLFAANGLTVAGWIRALRLQRVCRDLADPDLATRKIHTLATGWGFEGGAAHFSRVFKDAYGMSPRDFREQALGRSPTA